MNTIEFPKRSTSSMASGTMVRLLFLVCAAIYLLFILFSFGSRSKSTYSFNDKEEDLDEDYNVDFVDINDDHHDVLKTMLNDFIISPSSPESRNQEPNYERKLEEPTMKQMFTFVSALLGDKKNGFFVEAGAWDGGELSNTLYFEKKLGWTGLLIEPHPTQFKNLVNRQRNAYVANACVAVQMLPHKTVIKRPVEIAQPYWTNDNDEFWEHREEEKAKKTEVKYEEFEAQCFPLYNFLQAIGKEKDVDYLSLDVDGDELQVLQTIPWDEVTIKTISVAFNDTNGQQIKTFLEEQNFVLVDTLTDTWMRDFLFVYNPFLEAINGNKLQ